MPPLTHMGLIISTPLKLDREVNLNKIIEKLELSVTSTENLLSTRAEIFVVDRYHVLEGSRLWKTVLQQASLWR